MKISQDHSNRKAHNWLIYNVSDSWLNVLKVHFTGTLYDLGCGESPYKTWLLNHADQYIGVDWSGSYHETTADIVANLNEPLPIENEVADTVLSLSVMEHLSEPQVMLKEANRILKPGGGLFCKCLGNGGFTKPLMTSLDTHRTDCNYCLNALDFKISVFNRKPDSLPLSHSR
jgi:SAM-dependent methyltransferase